MKPFEYWKKNVKNYSVLVRIARIYLVIPASSEPFERIFFIGGDIITKKRNRLILEMFRWIMLLKNWGVISDIDDLFDNEDSSIE